MIRLNCPNWLTSGPDWCYQRHTKTGCTDGGRFKQSELSYTCNAQVDRTDDVSIDHEQMPVSTLPARSGSTS